MDGFFSLFSIECPLHIDDRYLDVYDELKRDGDRRQVQNIDLFNNTFSFVSTHAHTSYFVRV